MKKILLFILLSGCVVGPNYKPPCDEICEGFVVEECTEEPLCNWWDQFEDPLLSEYIELAAACNNDIKTAEMNVLVARAMKREVQASYFPQINGDFNFVRNGYSKNGPLFYISELLPQGIEVPHFQLPYYQSLYNLVLNLSWEIDIFGKIYRQEEAAQRQIESDIENRNDILVTVLAETASSYIGVRAAQKKLTLAYENLGYLNQIQELTKNRRQKGLDSDLNVLNVEANVENLLAEIPAYETEIYSNIYSLSVLTGNDPQALLCKMIEPKPLPRVNQEICLGLRSDLLLRRPDVRRAERNLAQAVAQIGVAYSQFFPSFSLMGSVGLQSIQLRKLFEGRSAAWSYGFDSSFPVFQGGYLTAALKASEANAAALAFQYKKAVLNALQDTETSLISYVDDLNVIQHLESSVQKFKRVRDLTFDQYNHGLVNMMSFLDRENDLINTEQTLVDNQQKALNDLISLYRALGGGWQCLPPCLTCDH